MESLINEYIEKFGEMPIIIGMFWSDQEKLKENIKQAIKNNKPYNEYDLLLEEEKKAFDNGELVF